MLFCCQQLTCQNQSDGTWHNQEFGSYTDAARFGWTWNWLKTQSHSQPYSRDDFCPDCKDSKNES